MKSASLDASRILERGDMVNPSRKTRLDVRLVEIGRFSSRARARAAIAEGAVTVNGRPADKASMPVTPADKIFVADAGHEFVSRGAFKLEAALDAFRFDPSARTCLDVGASTGGFAEVLLRRGARRVYCVDVGTGQLHPRIAEDPRAVRREGVNARDLGPGIVPEPVGCVVCDVSFISLKLALPPALALARGPAFAVALIKPQFEMGRERIGKGGIVRASGDELQALALRIGAVVAEQGWRVEGVIESPIRGGDGNREFLLGATRAA
jgi:23S rRNA (cytidine1920-2'-O)/16S rRNA (cytidine1409-2'-O)-methyltransferase